MSKTDPALLAFDAELDATGLLCPLPVLKARKRLAALAPGAVLRMRADDPAARVDVPHFCAEQGHALLAQRDAPGGVLVFHLRKGG
jgi:tRNA 2-thiouridine synthesizing protein A